MFKHLHKVSAFVLVCCGLLGGNEALAQTNPTPQSLPYKQDFSGLPHASTEYPAGWQGWQLAASNPTSFRTNAPTGDRVLVASSTSGSTAGGVHNYNQKLGYLTTGSLDPSVTFAINTLQKSSVTVTFDVMTIRNPYNGGASTRINEVILQYRIGTTGAFTNLTGTEYQNNTEATVTGSTEPQNLKTIAVILPSIVDNQQEVQLRWATREVSGGGSRPSFAFDNIEVKSIEDSNAPVVVVPQSLEFGDVIINKSSVQSYTLSAANLTGNLNLTATNGFTISKAESTGFASSISFSAAEMASNQTVFVRVAPTATGELTGTITHTSTGAKNTLMDVSANAVSPYVQNFNSCGTTLPGGWVAYSVTGDQSWACTTFGRETAESPKNSAVQINGFSGSARENEDWMISPALDLTDFNIAALSFWSRTAFKGPGMKLMVTSNYSGDPATTTWTELEGDFPALASDVWKQSVIDISAYKGAAVHVAFMYTSVAQMDGAARWSIDDFEVENLNQLLVTTNASFDFGVVEVPNVSAAQTFKFSAKGFEQTVTVAVGTDFQISKNGQTYTASLSYTPEEAAAQNTVYTRYKPTTTRLRSQSDVTISSGSFNEVKGILTGSSLPKSITLDILSWNLEWFGADKDDRGAELGPDNEELQFANTKKVLQTLDPDIIGFQEIANDEAMERLIAEMPEYGFVRSDVHSYSWDPSRGLVPQKLYVVYKKDIVKVKSQKVLLNNLYQNVVAGTATLPNYPAAQNSFWASGRLPFMVEVEATMNGVTQTLHLVNLHTRANSGSNLTPYNQRKYDVQVLKDSLTAQYPNINLVMLGDMNDDVSVSVVNNLPSTLDPFVLDNNYKTLTYDLSLAGGFTYAGGSFKSFLDHMIVSKSLADEYIDESVAIENQLLNLIPSYRTTTSDHVPVSARFSFMNTPAVTFTEAYIAKTEDAGKFAVNLSLSQPQPKAHTVYVTVQDGATATAADYITSPVVANNVVAVTVPANSSSATFEISIEDDKMVEPTEQVTFYINKVTTDLGMGAARNFTLAIQDNDIPVGIAINQEPLRLYPNPTKTTANIQLPERVTVLENMILVAMTAEGIKLFELQGNLTQIQQQFNDKVAKLRRGMYIINVQTANETFQARLVKN